MLTLSEPAGYGRSVPAARPKLDKFTAQIDQWLLEDKSCHPKQRHTAKRVFDRLKDEVLRRVQINISASQSFNTL